MGVEGTEYREEEEAVAEMDREGEMSKFKAEAEGLADELCRQARGRLGFNSVKFNAAIEVALTAAWNEAIEAAADKAWDIHYTASLDCGCGNAAHDEIRRLDIEAKEGK